MDENLEFNQFKKIWDDIRISSKARIETARNIYFDLIKLVITISFASIPLIGILVSSKNAKEVKVWILAAIIFLVLSIFAGIASLILHALRFKRSSNQAFIQLKEANNAAEKGMQEVKLWIQKQNDAFKKTDKSHEDLDYKWSICQLIFFILAIVLLAIAVFLILQ